ncbi:MAG: hypothetical protein J7L34_02205 [Thermotogaceae bacterium]|nr:hypothetical protein [Thermotogaceae bacterium]
MADKRWITADTTFEEIAESYPYLISPLLEMGIKVIVCGDVQWGTLGEEAEKLGLNIDEVLEKLNRIVEENGGPQRSISLNIGSDSGSNGSKEDKK